MTDRQAGGVSTEVLVQAGLVWRQAAGFTVEVLIPLAGSSIEYGVTGAAFPTTTILVKQADGSWRAVYPA